MQLSVALVALLLVHLAVATPTPSQEAANVDCPEDCTCSLAQHTHKPLLHLKCSSTKGLKKYEQIVGSDIPIHSIDLSYTRLIRVGHILDVLPDITSVDLSHNELHETGHLSKRIKKLNLKHNRLTSTALSRLPPPLQVLNLQHNDITYLPEELTHLRHLKQLELSHNAINCSCKTLGVRNWLQEQNVFMEHPVVCTYPLEARGKSWLQLKREDICLAEHQHQENWYEESDNELMMGDQPLAVSTEHEEEEELGKDFLPIDKSKVTKSAKKVARSPASEPDVEGSGDLSETNMEMVAQEVPQPPPEVPTTQAPASNVEHIAHDEPSSVEDEDDDADGSGSGSGILLIPPLPISPFAEGDDFDPATDKKSDDDEKYDQTPMEAPSPSVFNEKTIGIYKGVDENQDQAKPVNEDIIVPVVQTNLDTSVVTDGPLDDDSKESEDILAAKMGKHDDSNAIYYLLSVIALIVVGLILFVAIKRCKYNSNAAARDAEAQRQTELLDMDKKQLGKPLQKNGQERSPLIGEKTKLDEAQIINGNGTKKPYDNNEVKDAASQQQPLLNGNGSPANGKDVPTINEPSAPAVHEYYPITPRYPTPQSPRASKYAQHQAGDEPNNNDVETDGNATYPLPSSPKSGRYSPVYSPETGRVKIKLTETPRPKTPMLVTRSKSNAGDIITTPVTQPAVVNGH
ncbi:LOW QUALITY PROTEIN: protein windpipe [Drosophila tropicalis]|uniref:LOW QUALITY PROTEIN: protein windpipe n=1 Tax=Drosophila tropicalis TaxID=46794 RepID=UPI0035AB7482